MATATTSLKPITFRTSSTPEQLKLTIRLIGRGIRDGSTFLPIRHLAGRATSTSWPKNYIDQAAAIYRAITTDWWHYVKDPRGAEVLTIQPDKIFEVTLGRGSRGRHGYGDCDDIAVASGALLRSIGMDIRIATTVRPGSPYIFDHVFVLVKPSEKSGWHVFDPVLYPRLGFGDITDYKRIAIWSLHGDLISRFGPFPPGFVRAMALHGTDGPAAAPNDKKIRRWGTDMTPHYDHFKDFSDQIGFFGAADVIDATSMRDIPDFAEHGIVGFGCYSPGMGAICGDEMPHLMAEYDDTDTIGDTGLVRTKHFELAQDDYRHVSTYGSPYSGMLALADDGEVYVWSNPDGLGGFFKKLIRKGIKHARKIHKRVRRVAKKFVRKLPGGKLLWKLHSKLHRTAMKIARPLLRVVGPIATKIAPIAALIPGIGPAVAGALLVTGQVYRVAKKHGVRFDKQKRPVFDNKRQAREFSRELAREGRRMPPERADAVMRDYKRKHPPRKRRRPEPDRRHAHANRAPRRRHDVTRGRRPAFHGVGFGDEVCYV